jgi:hypothetical protein
MCNGLTDTCCSLSNVINPLSEIVPFEPEVAAGYASNIGAMSFQTASSTDGLVFRVTLYECLMCGGGGGGVGVWYITVG